MIRSPLAHDFILTPNIEPRKLSGKPDLLILHYTGMESAERACEWLCHPASRVSCHYLADERGKITQMAGEEMRAWHAGQSSWEGEADTNSRSIGIEIHNPGHTLGYPDFPPAQMNSVIALCTDILTRHVISPRHVLAHSDVAPLRKIDPGEKFDWAWLNREGIGHWVKPLEIVSGGLLQIGDKGQPVEALQSMLSHYGYGIAITGEYDNTTKSVVVAFQRHFRPAMVDGIADRSTIGTLHALLKSV